MNFTASDVSSLSTALSRWELAEYFSCGLVAIGCAGEYVAEFTNWLTDGIKESKEHLAKGSTLVLIFALALELVCLVKTNTLSGALIGSLDKEAGEADVLARGARQEADSFEKDIVSAKTQAAEAESHLAEALKRAADATAELDRLKSPRSLINTSEVITTLKAFKDTEYTFSSVFQDEESINLLKAIDSVLQSAGWKRMKPPGGFPAISVYGRQVDFAVPVALNTGIQVSADSEESLTFLQSLPLDKLPQHVRAAIALKFSLSSNVSPPQEKSEGRMVDVQPGTSGTIRIAVGKKP